MTSKTKTPDVLVVFFVGFVLLGIFVVVLFTIDLLNETGGLNDLIKDFLKKYPNFHPHGSDVYHDPMNLGP